MKYFLPFFIFIGFIGNVNPVLADNVSSTDSACHGRMINPFSDIDWRGMFPITIGSSDVVSGDLPDTDNPGNPICVCEYDPFPKLGLAFGYWEPMGLLDVTRTPYCLVNLGGYQIGHDDKAEGDVDTTTPDQNSSFYYVHYYNFPVLQWMGSWLLGGSCRTDGDFGIAYFSELDPTWNDEELAAIAFPETQWFENPVTALGAQAACAADSVSANTGLPSDSSFWCAGSQGFMYPMTGEVAEHIGDIQASTLITERTVFKMHHLGQISDTSSGDLCNEHWDYLMPKSRYRYQMVYPGQGSVEPFGRTTSIWGVNKENPLQGDDAGYVIFRKRNCCNY